MIITLYTDASHCPRTGAAGWAAWIRFGPLPTHVVRRGGALAEDPKTSTGAELAAIANGLAVVGALLRDGAEALAAANRMRQNPAPPGSRHVIHIRSDSTNALARLYPNWRGAVADYEGRCARAALELAELHNCDLQLGHVKGHRGKADKRAAVNTWCDAEAGRHMREARKRLEVPPFEVGKNSYLQGCGDGL